MKSACGLRLLVTARAGRKLYCVFILLKEKNIIIFLHYLPTLWFFSTTIAQVVLIIAADPQPVHANFYIPNTSCIYFHSVQILFRFVRYVQYT